MLEEVMQRSDEEFYQDLFTAAQVKKLTNAERVSIMQQSIHSAEAVYKQVAREIELCGIVAVIERYGTKLSYNELNEADTVIAMYDKKENLLIMFEHAIAQLQKQVVKKGMQKQFGDQLLKNLILAHELYHIIEMNEKDVFTYTKFFQYKWLGLTRHKRLAVASEIGAFHFSKLVNKIDFSPCVIHSLIVEAD